MKPLYKKIITIAIPILISITLVWYSLYKVPLEQIVLEAKKADYKVSGGEDNHGDGGGSGDDGLNHQFLLCFGGSREC